MVDLLKRVETSERSVRSLPFERSESMRYSTLATAANLSTLATAANLSTLATAANLRPNLMKAGSQYFAKIDSSQIAQKIKGSGYSLFDEFPLVDEAPSDDEDTVKFSLSPVSKATPKRVVNHCKSGESFLITDPLSCSNENDKNGDPASSSSSSTGSKRTKTRVFSETLPFGDEPPTKEARPVPRTTERTPTSKRKPNMKQNNDRSTSRERLSPEAADGSPTKCLNNNELQESSPMKRENSSRRSKPRRISRSKSGENLPTGQLESPSRRISRSKSGENLPTGESPRRISRSKSGENLPTTESSHSRRTRRSKSGENLSTGESPRRISRSKSGENLPTSESQVVVVKSKKDACDTRQRRRSSRNKILDGLHEPAFEEQEKEEDVVSSPSKKDSSNINPALLCRTKSVRCRTRGGNNSGFSGAGSCPSSSTATTTTTKIETPVKKERKSVRRTKSSELFNDSLLEEDVDVSSPCKRTPSRRNVNRSKSRESFFAGPSMFESSEQVFAPSPRKTRSARDVNNNGGTATSPRHSSSGIMSSSSHMELNSGTDADESSSSSPVELSTPNSNSRRRSRRKMVRATTARALLDNMPPGDASDTSSSPRKTSSALCALFGGNDKSSADGKQQEELDDPTDRTDDPTQDHEDDDDLIGEDESDKHDNDEDNDCDDYSLVVGLEEEEINLSDTCTASDSDNTISLSSSSNHSLLLNGHESTMSAITIDERLVESYANERKNRMSTKRNRYEDILHNDYMTALDEDSE